MGTKERKQREKEARRKDILEAAKSLFFEKGFNATTMEQIAEAAELSKGTLYLYFPSKEELYVTILLDGLKILHDRFTKATKGKKGWEKRVRSLGWAYYRFFRENENYFKIFFLLQHEEMASNVSEPLYQECQTKGRDCLEILSKSIQLGMDQGDIEKQDATEVAVVLWGSLTGIILLHQEEAHRTFLPSSLDHSIQVSIDLMMEGLRKRTQRYEAA